MNYNALIIFFKCPEKGKVKTRLAAKIGEEKALELYTCFLKDIINQSKSVNADTIIFYSGNPESLSAEIKNSASRIIPQLGNDLGERMSNAFKETFSSGYSRCILIGSDIPEITSGILNNSFTVLEKKDVVIGPSHDGGYYLIGFNRNSFEDSLFREVEWSTPSVLDTTVEKISVTGKTSGMIEKLNDIDTFDDIKHIIKNNKSIETVCPSTTRYLKLNGFI